MWQKIDSRVVLVVCQQGCGIRAVILCFYLVVTRNQCLLSVEIACINTHKNAMVMMIVLTSIER